jgi:protein-L-isoaspartate(D-aspartate) O-methyltransferase
VVQSEDPASGHPSQAPFEVILLVGSVPAVPSALLEQISESGRVVAVIDEGRVGKATLFTKLHGVIGRREICDAQTPPCPGLELSPGFAF